MKPEVRRVIEQYKRRDISNDIRYARLNIDVVLSGQERQRAIVSMLRRHNIHDLSNVSVLEVGCGSGKNLLELLQLGANPEKLVGNELLGERIVQARRVLPSSLRLYGGDASELDLPDEYFDIVYQSTVFSSILDSEFQTELAAHMWNLTRVGGGVLWYDFVYDNPRNPDVQGVSVQRIRELFPAGQLEFRRVTLAPPIARWLCRVLPSAYGFFNSVPFLRTHVLCWIGKGVQ